MPYFAFFKNYKLSETKVSIFWVSKIGIPGGTYKYKTHKCDFIMGLAPFWILGI